MKQGWRPPSEGRVDARVADARKALGEAGIDVIVVTGPENIFYLTGQQTPGYYTFQALVLPVDGEPLFVVRQLEAHQFRAPTPSSPTSRSIRTATTPSASLSDLIKRLARQSKRIAIDEARLVPADRRLQGPAGTPRRPCATAAGIIESLRAVKSPAEIAADRAAAAYVDAGMKAGLARHAAGATENDVVAAMMRRAIAAGAEYLGMEPLVSSRPALGRAARHLAAAQDRAGRPDLAARWRLP